jgi:hypothetical protein
LSSPNSGWKNNNNFNITMIVKEIGWKGVDSCFLAQDRDWWWALANKVISPHFQKNTWEFLD